MKLKLGILASGRGSNLQAIINACQKNEINAQVAVVISDAPTAQALERAKKAGIPTKICERKNFASKKEYEQALINELRKAQVELVCLAGYMKIVGKKFLAAFPNRVINIHPALLPSFPGLDAQKQAWEYGVKVSGCTVHFVDKLTDHGPIILQSTVPVNEDDTVEILCERILKEEHKLYSKAIQLIAENKIDIKGRKVRKNLNSNI